MSLLPERKDPIEDWKNASKEDLINEILVLRDDNSKLNDKWYNSKRTEESAVRIKDQAVDKLDVARKLLQTELIQSKFYEKILDMVKVYPNVAEQWGDFLMLLKLIDGDIETKFAEILNTNFVDDYINENSKLK